MVKSGNVQFFKSIYLLYLCIKRGLNKPQCFSEESTVFHRVLTYSLKLRKQTLRNTVVNHVFLYSSPVYISISSTEKFPPNQTDVGFT